MIVMLPITGIGFISPWAAVMIPYSIAAKETSPNTPPIIPERISAYERDNAENSANSAYNSFNYKQDKTLVCMKLGERTVSGNKCNDEKRSKINEHAQSLFCRIHKYYLL